MNLDEALDNLAKPAWVHSQSDASVALTIKATPGFAAPSKTLTPVADLHGPQVLRPVDVLRGLAYATRMHYVHPDVYDLYSMWAWIRYLGLFSRDSGDELILSPEARHVRGNQRRVTSEELGIGFAKAYGEQWMASSLGSGAVTFVDVDVVPKGGAIPFASGLHTVKSVSSRRPDYFMIHTDPTSGMSRVRVLESKGTSNPSNQFKQLATAVHQLEGVHINGSAPIGLAVSAALPDFGPVRVLSIDPPGRDRDEPQYSVRPPDTTVDGLGSTPEQEDSAEPGIFEASLARLADYAGSYQAAIGWAPNDMRERLYARPDEAVETLETPAGICVGRAATFFSGVRRVNLFVGVVAGVNSALASLDREQFLSAQSEFASALPALRSRSSQANDGRATSVGIDGTVLDIRLEV